MLTLTILCENTVIPSTGITGEHGFAVLIETEKNTFLFDTGQGQTIIHNAECLEKDLREISGIFLSHGHYDHTGGLEKVLNITGEMVVYAHPDIFLDRIATIKREGKRLQKNVGIPKEKKFYETLGARFAFNKTFAEVAPGMFLTGEVPRLTDFEKADKRLMIKKGNRLAPDQLRDDQSLVIQTSLGLVVVLGCAHSGMINTLDYIKNKMTGQKIHMVMGGTHVAFLTDVQVCKTIERLKKFSIDRIGVSHCTGLSRAVEFMQAFGDSFFFANAGNVIQI